MKPNMQAALLTSTVLLSVSIHAPADDTWQDLPGYTTQSNIDSNVMSNVRGRFVVNMAAGDSNAQINAGAVALGGPGSTAVGIVHGIQLTHAGQATQPDIATANIGINVLTNSSGLISINQTSGVGNAQANGAAFAMGFEEVVAESVLAAATSNAGPAVTGNGNNQQSASIHDTAFDGSSGLVQVNQSAGSGNSTANNFALEVNLGAKQ